ncbi:MAG TPA: hypothetical protein VLB87_11350, partial [Pyrinomonadaceae bacterium]|nr:hypothetical protein [Pyrinomonadaceae bacterium]
TEGEFGGIDLSRVDSASLISAFKSRMQILYLMLPLTSPANREEEERFFPPPIKAIFERKPPQSAAGFPAYTQQLKRDVADLRAHLDQLAARYPSVADRIRDFKTDLLKELRLPEYPVQPLTAYSKGKVLPLNAQYYRIDSYSVIREQGQMKIIGITFFGRIF